MIQHSHRLLIISNNNVKNNNNILNAIGTLVLGISFSSVSMADVHLAVPPPPGPFMSSQEFYAIQWDSLPSIGEKMTLKAKQRVKDPKLAIVGKKH